MINIKKISFYLLVIWTISSCCILVKDHQNSYQSPSEVVACFLDAIIDGDYQTAAFYISDESTDSIHQLIVEINNLREIMEDEIEDLLNSILLVYNLTASDLFEMTDEELIATVIIVGMEMLEVDCYEIISEQIIDNSAIVKVLINYETEIVLVNQDGLWKIRLDI